MRILRHPSRPGPRNSHHLGSFLPAPRAPESLRALLEGHLPADQPCERLGLYLADSTTLADHSYQEMAEAIIEPLDMRQHAHGRVVRATVAGVYSVRDVRTGCMLRGATGQGGKMAKNIGPTFEYIALAACAGATNVVPERHDAYMIASHGTMGWSSGPAQKAKALEEAGDYCKRMGKEMEPISETDSGPGGFGKIVFDQRTCLEHKVIAHHHRHDINVGIWLSALHALDLRLERGSKKTQLELAFDSAAARTAAARKED